MKYQCILLDLETQRDFFAPGGSCYRPQAARAARQIYRLFGWARKSRIPVISTVLRVRGGTVGPLAATPHCIDGSVGERKLSRTLLPRRIDFGLRNSTDLPRDLFNSYQQVIFEKREADIFSHARLERLITELPPSTFVLCGAGVATSLMYAAVGLRSRGFGVILAADAVVDLGEPSAEMAYRRMEAKGVVFAPAKEIISPVHQPIRPFRRYDALAKVDTRRQ